MKTLKPTPEANRLFHDAAQALSQVEANGVRVDTVYLNEQIENIDNKIKELEKELQRDPVFRTWRKRFGRRTNIDSGVQLGTVIFDVMGHSRKDVRVTDTGKEKYDEASFSHLDIPFVRTYFRAKKLKKALSTYLLGIRRELQGNFIHPSYNLNSVTSYRSSCDMPNFQNVPARNPEIAEIVRRCYVSRGPDYRLGEIDFSGIEVRVSACYNRDPNLIRYIKDPSTDMHRDTASDLFFLSRKYLVENAAWAKKGVRDWAKNRFVFPQFYGSVWFQCAPNIWQAVIDPNSAPLPDGKTIAEHLLSKGIRKLGDCDPESEPAEDTFAHHVREVERTFWGERFKVYADWKRRWWDEYQSKGGFRLLTGFVCQGVFKRNEVINYPVQGSAFHCLLWSLVQIQRWLNKNKMKTKIVGEIHDSLVVDMHVDEEKEFLAKCKQVMTVDLLKHWDWIIVPMEIEAEFAPPSLSWHNKKKVEFS